MAQETQFNNIYPFEMYPVEYTFNLSDFALFLSVMKDKRAYQNVLSIILNEPDVKVVEVKVEQVILNKFGKRAIRLDAWGRTEDDIFQKDMAMYTFTEQCEEIQGLHLNDGTKKIFLNMSSKNGSKELVSLLQYMKSTTLDNPEIQIQDKRIIELDKIVTEVKESEEWEEVKMNFWETAMTKGVERGAQINQIQLICKKMAKGYSVSDIADMLEEDEAIVKNIVDIAMKYKPDYDAYKIYSDLCELNKVK